jgi:hypothetical protein
LANGRPRTNPRGFSERASVIGISFGSTGASMRAQGLAEYAIWVISVFVTMAMYAIALKRIDCHPLDRATGHRRAVLHADDAALVLTARLRRARVADTSVDGLTERKGRLKQIKLKLGICRFARQLRQAEGHAWDNWFLIE